MDAQRQKINEFCQHDDMKLIKIYADEGISGSSVTKRPGIQELLEDAKSKKFDMVVVWKNSRIARNTKDLLEMVDLFQKNGIGFASVSEKIDLDSAQGRFMFTIMGTVSELERNNIAENVYLGMYKRAQEGYATVGRVLGYKPGIDELGKKILKIEPEEAKIIRLIFNLFDQEKGLRAIANELNHRGYQTKNGNEFSTIAVKGIIDNPLYVGQVRYAKYRNWDKKRRNGLNEKMVLVQGKHEPIISQELWNRVEARRKSTSKLPAWDHQGTNILTGLLKCPACGGPMAASNTTNTLKDGTKKRIRYYSCANFRNKGSKVCHANSIRAEEAETLVMKKLLYVVTEPNIVQIIARKMDKEKNANIQLLQEIVSNKEAIMKDLEARVSKYEDLGREDAVLAQSIASRKVALINEIVGLQAEINQCSKKILAYGNGPTSTSIKRVVSLIKEIISNKERKYLKRMFALFIDNIQFSRKEKLIWVEMFFDDKVVQQIKKHQREGAGSLKGAPAPSLQSHEEIIIKV
ncbi:integrase [Liquorilactobacillus aquaticus DSM 21051]|uniref:Integrase n=1 Tax=Liquorilactobacillus aquaticus DSM 21051 TaxID=1423725 RepID=A0A0R2CZX9_9LACO|nr:integrase [Liquorilactobacillus aquaticus DSM 21051]